MALRSLLRQPVGVPAISALLCVCVCVYVCVGGRRRSARSISPHNAQVRAQLLRYLAPTGARRLHTPAAKEHTTEKVSECVSEREREREREREGGREGGRERKRERERERERKRKSGRV